MKALGILILGLLVGCHTNQKTPAEIFSMESVQWKKRPVIIFESGESFQILADAKKDWSGFSERDIVFWIVNGDDAFTFDNGSSAPLPPNAASTLRKRFLDTQPVVLVGKDGGAKLKGDQTLSSKTVFNTIDAMPMRQDEMNR